MTLHRRIHEPQLTVVRQREWPGARASLVQTNSGRYVGGLTTHLSVMFHIGVPARVRCDYDGATSSRVQTHGRFDLMPVGCRPIWDEYDPTLTLNVCLSQSLLETASRTTKPALGAVDLGPKISEEDDRLFGVAQLLKSELESDTPDDLFAESLATVMSVRVLERYGVPESVADGATLSKRQLRQVIEHIEANLAGEIRLSSLSSLAGLSESHFRVLFRRSTGRPVHRYVIDRRLERARELLQSGALPVAQVALEAGFCHQSHLARTMRREWQTTPSQVARKARSWG
jgi:AraC family transcriptional regulator